MTWHIIGILVFVVIYNIWRYYHEDDSDDYGSNIEPEPKNNEVNGTNMEETISTRQLALRTIENIGSEPKYDEVNLRDTLSVVYTISDSDDVALHIKTNFLLVPEIKEVEGYLKLILNSFFRTSRMLELEIEKCRMQECEHQV